MDASRHRGDILFAEAVRCTVFALLRTLHASLDTRPVFLMCHQSVPHLLLETRIKQAPGCDLPQNARQRGVYFGFLAEI